MNKPGPKRLRRTEHYVAIRATAVRAAKEAFPHMTSTEIAAALHLDRHMVKRYLLGDVKSLNQPPPWAEDLFAACRLLTNTTQPARAAEAFDRLARRLAA